MDILGCRFYYYLFKNLHKKSTPVEGSGIYRSEGVRRKKRFMTLLSPRWQKSGGLDKMLLVINVDAVHPSIYHS